MSRWSSFNVYICKWVRVEIPALDPGILVITCNYQNIFFWGGVALPSFYLSTSGFTWFDPLLEASWRRTLGAQTIGRVYMKLMRRLVLAPRVQRCDTPMVRHSQLLFFLGFKTAAKNFQIASNMVAFYGTEKWFFCNVYNVHPTPNSHSKMSIYLNSIGYSMSFIFWGWLDKSWVRLKIVSTPKSHGGFIVTL